MHAASEGHARSVVNDDAAAIANVDGVAQPWDVVLRDHTRR